MRYCHFAIDDRPQCCWGAHLPEQNVEFLNRLDPMFFSYLSKLHEPALGTDDRQRAAIALRLAYGHALETFFALLFAGLQAPGCVPGWISRYRISDVPTLVEKVMSEQPFPSRIQLGETSWEGIATVVFAHLEDTPSGTRDSVTARLARVWERFAADYLCENRTREFNSIKHGLRVGAGGFEVLIGQEPVPGVRPPHHARSSLGGSDYGSSFFVPIPIEQTRRGFRLDQHSLNWDPAAHARGLELLAMSISDVVSFLKLQLSVSEREPYVYPATDESADAPWADIIGVTSMALNPTFDGSRVRDFTDDEILRIYE